MEALFKRCRGLAWYRNRALQLRKTRHSGRQILPAANLALFSLRLVGSVSQRNPFPDPCAHIFRKADNFDSRFFPAIADPRKASLCLDPILGIRKPNADLVEVRISQRGRSRKRQSALAEIESESTVGITQYRLCEQQNGPPRIRATLRKTNAAGLGELPPAGAAFASPLGLKNPPPSALP